VCEAVLHEPEARDERVIALVGVDPREEGAGKA